MIEPKRRQAIAAGAVELSLQQMGQWLNDARQRMEASTPAIPPSTVCTWCGHETHHVQCPRQVLVYDKP